MEQQQTYESGLLLLHPEDNPRAAPGLAQPLSREEDIAMCQQNFICACKQGIEDVGRDMLHNNA